MTLNIIKQNVKDLIKDLVNRETQAWDTQDTELLISIFHTDMVWPWPETAEDHDPMKWVIPWGRYNYERWSKGWQNLFDTHKLIHNKREIKRIKVSEQNDGGFAVGDIDTLWRDREGNESHWKGRVCKVYTRMAEGKWKLIMHTGVLKY